MAHRSKERLASHVESEVQRLRANEGLPFRELLDESRLIAALQAAGIKFRDRIYTPMVTLCAFLLTDVAGEVVSKILA